MYNYFAFSETVHSLCGYAEWLSERRRMDETGRKITKIAREVAKFTVQTMKEEGIGTAADSGAGKPSD